MKLLIDYFRELYQGTVTSWNRFWFSAVDPATYSLIRLLGGAMILYTHLAWTPELENFFGPRSWLSPVAVRESGEAGVYAWSYFWLIDSTAVLWVVHIAALIAMAMLMLGLFSRVTAVLTFLAVVSYANRVPSALFGLDQINGLLALYLTLGPSGAHFSLDRLLARWRGQGPLPPAAPSVGANLGVRMIQVHMCIVYLFAGLGKLTGEAWWDGRAMWLSVANLEYQSLDMTWIANWPILVSFLTHATIAWEVSYAALIWPRLTRPIMIALAISVHLGIAIALGMKTFGLVMLIANMAFISPWVVRAVFRMPPAAGSEGAPAAACSPEVKRRNARTSRPSAATK